MHTNNMTRTISQLFCVLNTRQTRHNVMHSRLCCFTWMCSFSFCTVVVVDIVQTNEPNTENNMWNCNASNYIRIKNAPNTHTTQTSPYYMEGQQAILFIRYEREREEKEELWMHLQLAVSINLNSHTFFKR